MCIIQLLDVWSKHCAVVRNTDLSAHSVYIIRIMGLDMLTAQEILSTTYRKMREEPLQLCVYETGGDRSYSNSEFLAMIGRCTNYLKDNGIARKDIVVINIGRSALHFALRYA